MIFKNIKKIFHISLIFPVFIFILDRISKIYVINLSKISFDTELFSSKYLNITLIWNEGIAFGIFSFEEKIFYNLITIIIGIVIMIIIWLMLKAKGLEKYSFIMVLGGSLGNIFDRLTYSAVPDFIDFHYKSFHWFIFNVADIFITLGVLLLIFKEFFTKKRDLK